MLCLYVVSYCLVIRSELSFSISSLSILCESTQEDEGQGTQHVVNKKLYTVLSKGLNDRATNLSIKLLHNKEVSFYIT